MDLVKRLNETIHIGEDWRRAYTITDDIDISIASAVCKIRSKQGKLLCEAETVINNKTIFVTISKETTLEINKIYTKAVYDVFLTQDNVSHKLIMGDITIIHDISMH